MSLGTAQARSSVFEVPGLQLCPYPTNVITASDRVMISDLYAGLLIALPVASNQTCWAQEVQVASNWSAEQQSNNTWIPETESEQDTWTKEDPMKECND